MSDQSSPRRPVLRGILTALIVASVVGIWLGFKYIIVNPLLGSGPLGDWIVVAVPVLATGLLAPFASYRYRDAIAWLILPIGVALLTRLAWRVAYLPYRDWPPRLEEAPGERIAATISA